MRLHANKPPRLFGNMLLSKLRISQVYRHSLPWPPDPAHPAGMPRGLIDAVIDAPGGKATSGAAVDGVCEICPSIRAVCGDIIDARCAP